MKDDFAEIITNDSEMKLKAFSALVAIVQEDKEIMY